MTSRLELHQPSEITLPVPKDLLKSAYEADPNTFGETADTSIINHLPPGVEYSEMVYNQLAMATPYSMPVDSLDNEVTFFLEGRSAGRDRQGNERYYLQTQDKMVLELLQNNLWLRPIYFANTVSRDGLLGLDDYFQFEGKAFRIVPKARETGPFGYVDTEVHADRLSQFKFTLWDSPDVYFDGNIRRMLGNYRYGFTQLADSYLERNDTESAAYWLKYGEDKIPFRNIENDWTVAALYAFRYMRVNEDDRANELAEFIQERLMEDLRYDMRDLDRLEIRIGNMEEEVQRARAQANTGKAQSLNREVQRLSQQRNNVIEDVSFTVSRLSILQNIYFETDRIEKAEELSIEVNVMTEGRLPIPENIEESREQIERFGLEI